MKNKIEKAKSEHTPGPWTASGPLLKRGIDWMIKEDAPQWVSAEHTLHIWVAPCSDGFVSGQNSANAQLIAAAPDLLAALENILAAFVHVPGDIEGNKARTIAARIIGSPNGTLARAREAIDKATRGAQ